VSREDEIRARIERDYSAWDEPHEDVTFLLGALHDSRHLRAPVDRRRRRQARSQPTEATLKNVSPPQLPRALRMVALSERALPYKGVFSPGRQAAVKALQVREG